MATFHSVQDAVKLFNAGLSGGQPLNKRQEEETNLWSQEVNKLKEKIKNAEMAKLEALLELDEAKKTVEHLNHKLRNDEKALNLSSSNVRDVTSELGIAKELLQRVVAEEQSHHDLDATSSNVIVVTSELGFAKESLHRVAEEESELCMLMESLKLELQNVKKEHAQLKEKEQRETEQALEGELKKEAEEAKRELLQLEEELKLTFKEAEEAKAKSVEECLNVQESYGGGILTETEALRACRDETLKKLEMSEKEIEDIKALTQEALKKAEMAEEATIVVDLELRKRRNVASRMWAKSFPSAKEVNKSKSRSKETCLVKC